METRQPKNVGPKRATSVREEEKRKMRQRDQRQRERRRTKKEGERGETRLKERQGKKIRYEGEKRVYTIKSVATVSCRKICLLTLAFLPRDYTSCNTYHRALLTLPYTFSSNPAFLPFHPVAWIASSTLQLSPQHHLGTYALQIVFPHRPAAWGPIPPARFCGHTPPTTCVSSRLSALSVFPLCRGLSLNYVPFLKSTCFFGVSLSFVPLAHEPLYPHFDYVVPFLRLSCHSLPTPSCRWRCRTRSSPVLLSLPPVNLLPTWRPPPILPAKQFSGARCFPCVRRISQSMVVLARGGSDALLATRLGEGFGVGL